MYWSTFARPVPLEESGWVNTMYLATGSSVWDPMMVWGTNVETEALDEFLAEQRDSTGLLLSPAHVLVRVVAQSLREHPQVNRRVFGRRVYQYDGVNILMPMLKTRSGEVETVFLRRADSMSLSDVAQRMWTEVREKSRLAAEEERRRREGGALRNFCVALGRRLRLRGIHAFARIGCALGNWRRAPTIWRFQQELQGAGAFVNYLGFPGAPPMISFKPSCLPMNSYSVNVTMGPSESRCVAVNGAVVIRKQAPMFVRADHRIVNAFQAAEFIKTLRSYLADPWSLISKEQRAPDALPIPVATRRTDPAGLSGSNARLQEQRL